MKDTPLTGGDAEISLDRRAISVRAGIVGG
jgi:hypothetical protein